MQLTAFVDAGGTLVDTADVYCDGESERTLGRLLADVVPRSDVLVATKAVGRTGPGPMGRGASRGHLLAALDASLERLRLDHVDLWQLHAWDEATPLEETLAACDVAVSSGRARYVGVSNFTGWQTAQAATWQRAWPGRTPLVSTQVEYSLLQRGVEREVVPAAEALGLGVLPWSPLGRGLLTGKYRHATPSESRGASPQWQGFIDGLRSAHLRPDRRGGDHRRRGPGDDAAGGRAGLGARPARASSRRSSARAPPSSCRPPWTPRRCGCPRRSARRWRTSPRRPSATPSGGRSGEPRPPQPPPRGDPVFAAFCAAGLWPGLGKRAAAELPAARASPPRTTSPPTGCSSCRGSAGSAPSGCSPRSCPPSPPTRSSSCWSAPGWRPSSPPAWPTRSVPTPPGGCATTPGRCSG